MKKAKNTEKKLSLEKLQLVKINNPKIIKGGQALLEDKDRTNTVPTSENI